MKHKFFSSPVATSASGWKARAPRMALAATAAGRYGGLALALSAALTLSAAAAEPSARVVAVRDSAAVRVLDVAAERVPAMVSRGLRTLTGQTTEAAAWAKLVAPHDVIGIKINTEAVPLHATHRAVVDALADSLRAAGVASTNIIVWARSGAQLAAAGYESNERYQVRAVIEGAGWDSKHYHHSSLVGKLIWGDLLYGKEEGDVSTRSHLPKLLTQTLTKLINVPVLQDHDATGLTGCLYNLSLGMVDNQRRFEVLGQRGEPDIAAICAMPEIREKVVLQVMDGLVGGYAGGPSFKPKYSWPQATLYFSRDPVAIDVLALEAIEKQRAAAHIQAIGDRASHIQTAAKAGLGVAARDKIEVVETTPE